MSGFTPNYFGGPAGQTDEEAAFYGKDILFDGKLHVGSDGDYVTVNGFENLRRSLLRRMLVVPGEFRLVPEYGAGVKTFVKKKFTATVKAELTKRVRAQILRDRRISKVLSLDITQIAVGDETAIKISLRAESRGRRFEPQPFVISRET